MAQLKSASTAMGEAPILPLIGKLALPCVAAQIINVLYNVVDSIYVGHMAEHGRLALTALGLCTPMILILTAFSAFVGGGSAPLAAISLGKQDPDKAEAYLGHGVRLLLIISTCLAILAYIFKDPLLSMFGASADTLPFASSYLDVYLLGTWFVQLSLGLNAFIAAQGLASFAMLSVLVGAIANIILDPIFIYLFKMGVVGAGLATVLSQGLSAAYIIWFLQSKHSALHIRKKYVKGDAKMTREVLSLGISGFVINATESAILIVFNSQLQRLGGDVYVGAMSIMQRAMQIMFVLSAGFTQGVQPLVSYNFGARKFNRIKQTLFYTQVVTFTWNGLFYLFCWLAPATFANIFVSDAALVEVVVQFLPIYLVASPFFSIQNTAQIFFVGVGNAKVSLFIALLRKVFLLIPLAFILPHFFGVAGVVYAEPAADFCSLTVAAILLFKALQRFRLAEYNN